MVPPSDTDFFTHALSCLPMAVMATDAGGIVRWVNESFCELTGYSLAQAEGQRLEFLAGESSRELLREALADCTGVGSRLRVEIAGRRKNGQNYPLELTVAPVTNCDRTGTYAIWLLREASAAVDRNREIERRYAALYDSMHEGVALHRLTYSDGVPAGYVVLDVNRRFEEILGVKRQDVINRSAREVYGTQEPPYLREYISVVQSGAPLQFETYFPPLNKHFAISVAPLGKAMFATIFFDITRQKKTEAQYALISENAADVIWLWNLYEGRCEYISPSVRRLRGFMPEEILAQPMEQAMPPEVFRRVGLETAERVSALEAGDESARVRTDEIEFLCKDGTSIATETVTTILSDDAGHARLVVGVSRGIAERKRAEDALRKSEEKFSMLFQSSPAAMSVNDLDDGGRFVDVNDAFESVTGYDRKDVIGRTADDIGLWIDAEEKEQAGAQIARDGRLRNLEHRFRRKNGEVGTGLLSLELLSIEGKRYALVANVDITERKRAEEALRGSEESLRASKQRFEDIAMSVGEWVWEVDERFVYTYSSQRGFDLFGDGDSAVLGRSPFDFMAPEDARRVASIFAGIAAAKAPIKDLENWNIRKDGERICLLTNAVPILDENGNLKGYRGVDKDITARKRAEEEIARLAAAIEQAAETIVITDANGTILYANPAFEKSSGYSVAEAMGQNPRMLKSGKHDVEFYRHMWEALARGEVWRGRIHNRRKDGTPYIEDVTISPVRDKDGRVVNYIALKLDVTREADLQAQLAQAQKMESIGRLAGGVAHDFNNLLTVINGYARMAIAELRPGDPLRWQIEEIAKAGERAVGLTRQLLAFSRKQILQPRVLDLNRIVGGMQSMLRRLVGEDVEVGISLCSEAPMVRADPHQLEQVIMNLAVNSRDAMPQGGKLSIETGLAPRADRPADLPADGYTGSYALLCVSDTGEGMDEATRQRIFEPFFTTKGVGRGTGLGLSMVQGIVAQSGGYIDIDSESGRGTTFKIYLPCLEGETAEPEIPAPALEFRGKERILVVEDQAEVREYAAAVLRSYGYRVIEASNAGEALMISERPDEPIDLVLTDVVMPHASGWELVSRLTKLRPGIRTMFMSGYTESPSLQHGALPEGANFIQKPFSPEELAGKVRAALGTTAAAAKILVADDEPQVRSFLRAVLESGGYVVSEAAEGRQALQQALSGHLDLVITDLVMPEQEGIETIQALREQLPAIGIIAISGAFEGQFLRTAELLGADSVLEKPVSADILLARVAEVLSCAARRSHDSGSLGR